MITATQLLAGEVSSAWSLELASALQDPQGLVRTGLLETLEDIPSALRKVFADTIDKAVDSIEEAPDDAADSAYWDAVWGEVPTALLVALGAILERVVVPLEIGSLAGLDGSRETLDRLGSGLVAHLFQEWVEREDAWYASKVAWPSPDGATGPLPDTLMDSWVVASCRVLWPAVSPALLEAAVADSFMASSTLMHAQLPESLEQLTGLLRATSQYRWCAARGLGGLRDPRSIPFLLDALRDDEDWAVRSTAAEALGIFGHEAAQQAIRALIGALRDDSVEMVRASAAESLGSLGGYNQTAVNAALVEAISDQSQKVAGRSAFALGFLGPDVADTVLIELLASDERDLVRMGAAEGLGKSRTKAGVSALSSALYDADESVQVSALLALKEIGDPACIADVLDWLVRSGDGEQLFVDRFLDSLGEAGRLPLRAEVSRRHPDKSRVTAIRAIRRLGVKPKDISALIKALNEPDWTTDPYGACLEEAKDALAEGGPAAVKPLLTLARDGLESDSRLWAIEALGRIDGDPKVISKLIPFLVDPEKRGNCLWAIGDQAQTGARSAGLADELLSLADDPELSVRTAVARAMSLVPDRRFAQPLITMAESETSFELLEYAIVGLSALADERALPALELLLDESRLHGLVRAAIASIYKANGYD